MARARNIKPSFFNHDGLADNEPLGRLLFIGLWTIADYKGELEWRGKRVKAQILPYDDCDIELLAKNLERSGFIRFYSVSGIEYIHVVNFGKHQNPHKNEKANGSSVPSIEDAEQAEEPQVIDAIDITINPDLSGEERNEDGSNPASSLIPHPESLLLIPDPHNHGSGQKDLLYCKQDDPVAEVIALLNLMTNSKYNAAKETAAKHVRARLAEGHSVLDLMDVIRFKCNEWMNKPDMAQYLRPQTLFQPEKFNGYLLAARQSQSPLAGLSDISRKNAQNLSGDW